jgi:hypothetical protein
MVARQLAARDGFRIVGAVASILRKSVATLVRLPVCPVRFV